MIRRLLSATAKVVATMFGLLAGIICTPTPIPPSPTLHYVCADMADLGSCWIDSVTGEDGITRKVPR